MSMKRIIEVIEEQKEHCVIEGVEPDDLESLLMLGYSVSHIASDMLKERKNKILEGDEKTIAALREKIKILSGELVTMKNCIEISGRVGADWQQVAKQLSIVITRALENSEKVKEK